jgi:hypothetical protein
MYVYADSTNRDTLLYPSGNSYILHLTTPAKSVTRVDLVAAKVPNAMYNINTGNNCITVGTTPFSIPNGFYSAYGIAEALNNRIGVEVRYLPDEGKLWFFSSISSFTIQALSPELQRVCGLASNAIYTAQLTTLAPQYNIGTPGYFIKSDNVVDLSTNEFVFLDIDELRTTQVTDSKALVGETYSSRTISSTFAMIPMDVSSGCIKNFKEGPDYIISITYPQPIVKLSRLTVRWYDKTGQLLNFNGFENNAFVLRVHEIQPHEDTPEETSRSITEVQLQRMIEDLIPPPAPPKPEVKKIVIPRFMMYLILFIVIGLAAFTFLRPPQVINQPQRFVPQVPLRPSVAPRLI